MAELSRCNVLRDARTVVERDIVMSALAQRPLKQTVGDTTRIAVGALAAFGDVRDSLVGSGGEHAVDAYRFLRALLETPAGLRWYLEQTDEEIRNNAVGNNLLHLDEFARVASDDRELIGTRSRALFVRVYCARLTIHLQVFLLLSFQRIGRDFREVLSAGPDAAVGFFRSIPYFDIEIGLREFIHFDKSRAWDRNDTNDIAALSLAVPACQVVTTDKYWSNACKKLELDAKYATQITHKLGEIDTDILE